ncbi:conserved hypothetical protein [Theileria equi strain WA]|uniref:Uncharacterized protein n=1 Tax=Theileria equi strain WA TaxID=1537102 RepID=L1LD46_THEEQ|nr:conserved hypothetical protein [Theileria equi strain WA]EKX73352.1 conserved hypothetical protein [Theileria equi strain WA]|eukprot:XP_004832804.1 conserved hypothetical protein [Theileria equi strain WA]
MALQDSILNKEGRAQIWVETLDSKTYKISPEFRIPRTWKVFNKVLSNYLASNTPELHSTDGNILIERVSSVQLPEGMQKVHISQGSQISQADKVEEMAKEQVCFYIPLNVESDDVEVFKTILFKETPKDANHSQRVENECSDAPSTSVEGDKDDDDDEEEEEEEKESKKRALEKGVFDKNRKFDKTLTVSKYKADPISTCYTVVCLLERALKF